MFFSENVTNKLYKALLKLCLKVYEEEKCYCLYLPFLYYNQTLISKGSLMLFFLFCKFNLIILLSKKMKIYLKQYIKLAIVISKEVNLGC